MTHSGFGVLANGAAVGVSPYFGDYLGLIVFASASAASQI